MSTNIQIKKSIQHKIGNQLAIQSDDLPTPVITNSFLHKTLHAAGHDLRSPLFIIRSYSQLLQRTQEKKLLDNGLQLMDEATIKMEKTINELVHLIDIYTLPFPDKTTVSFEAAYETAQFQLVHLINKYQPKLTFDFNNFPSVHFDEKYLTDIFSYLIDNAIRHNANKEDLEIKISSKKVDNDLVLTIQDNGRGIEDDPENVQSPFYTYTTQEDTECVGMGLAKLQAIAKMSQNLFYLQSKPGVSTTVSFVFRDAAL